MKKKYFPMMFLTFMILSCSHLPAIHAPAEESPAGDLILKTCEAIYPSGEWQFLHIIEATPPGSGTRTLMGLSQIHSRTRNAHCVLMTLEGLVLFEAQYDGTVDILRAVPPFDKPGFAEGLIEDIMLIYFKPDMPLTHIGHLDDGARVCRFFDKSKGAEDIILPQDTTWRIIRYDNKGKLIREVTPDVDGGDDSYGFPERVTLKAPGILGYRLTLSLVSVEPLQTKDGK